jgi:hypothetical protein
MSKEFTIYCQRCRGYFDDQNNSKCPHCGYPEVECSGLTDLQTPATGLIGEINPMRDFPEVFQTEQDKKIYAMQEMMVAMVHICELHGFEMIDYLVDLPDQDEYQNLRQWADEFRDYRDGGMY